MTLEYPRISCIAQIPAYCGQIDQLRHCTKQGELASIALNSFDIKVEYCCWISAARFSATSSRTRRQSWPLPWTGCPWGDGLEKPTAPCGRTWLALMCCRTACLSAPSLVWMSITFTVQEFQRQLLQELYACLFDS